MKNIKLLAFPLLLMILSSSAFAARIVAYSDEWVVSNTGFTQAGSANATQFAQNVASFLKGTPGAGSFLIYTDSFGLAESNFQSALTSAGHTVSFLLSTNPLPADLSPYNGIFLSGLPGTATAVTLTNFVNTGKGVFIAAGNGFTPGVEAGRWNAFLNNFGLSYSTVYNGIQGNINIAGSHQIMNGVAQYYYDNGNNVILVGGNPFASIVGVGPGNTNLIGVYDSTLVPEPASLALLGIAVLGAARRRKNGIS